MGYGVMHISPDVLREVLHLPDDYTVVWVQYLSDRSTVEVLLSASSLPEVGGDGHPVEVTPIYTVETLPDSPPEYRKVTVSRIDVQASSWAEKEVL